MGRYKKCESQNLSDNVISDQLKTISVQKVSTKYGIFHISNYKVDKWCRPKFILPISLYKNMLKVRRVNLQSSFTLFAIVSGIKEILRKYRHKNSVHVKMIG